MGGGTGTGVGEGYYESAEGLDGITVANFGDVMLLGFAQHLREYDAFKKRIQEIGAVGESFERQARAELPDTLLNPSKSIDLDKLVSMEDISIDLIKSSAAAFIIRETANGYSALYQPNSNFDVAAKMFLSVVNRNVTVEAINKNDSPIKKLKYRAGAYENHGSVNKVKGRIKYFYMDAVSTEAGDMYIDGRFGQNYGISPLINRKNGYTSTVKLTFEE